jgi:chemotaxis protein CheY-P-specific phosphatase CheC
MSAVFSPEEVACLSEMIGAGVQLSGVRLAKISRTEWKSVTASIDVVPVVHALAVFHNDKDRHLGAQMRSRSVLPLEFLLLFPEKMAARVAGIVAKASPAMQRLSDPVKPVLEEVANITGQAVVKEMADRFGISIILSAPKVSSGSKGALAAGMLEKFNGHKDVVVMMRVEMSSDDLQATCSMLMMLDVDVVKRFLAKAMKPE